MNTRTSILALLAIGVLASLGTFSRRADATSLLTAPFLSFDTGRVPFDVATGDLNGDGKADLVTANAGDSTISVMLGIGDGTFRTKTDYGRGRPHLTVAIGDLNGDGRPDLVTPNYSDTTVSVLLGNGDGTFAAERDFRTGNSPFAVAIGDLNRDSIPDLAVTNAGDSTISVLLGNGDGTFRAKTDFGTGSFPTSVAIGDLDRDGNPDLVTANNGLNLDGHTVSVMLGHGDGTFGAKTDFGTGLGPTSVAIADLNGDGSPDLVTANSGDISISVLLGRGDGTLEARTDYGTGVDPHLVAPKYVAIGDLNGDGRSDVVASNYGSSTVSVRLGNGDGTLGANTRYGTGAAPLSVAIGDLNGDGRLDVVTANSSGTVSVLLGNSDGTLGAGRAFDTIATPISVAIGDLNGDGKPDLVTANFLSRTMSVLLGTGHGAFGAPSTISLLGAPQQYVAIGDLNGDGKPDLVGMGYFGNTISVLLGNGDGTFSASTDYGAGIGPRTVAIGDLNGDGKPDLVIGNYITTLIPQPSTITLLFGNGDGSFHPDTDYVTGGGPVSVAIADLNGDGRPDLVAANYGDSTISVLLGDGAGSFGAKTDYGTGSSPASVGVRDLNGDGNLDLVTSNDISNTVSVLLGDGNGTFRAKTDYRTGYRPVSLAISDLNGDGAPDLATANQFANTVSVLLGYGDGTFRAKTDYGTGGGPVFVAIGDLSDDGRPDVVTANYGFNASDSTVWVLLNTGGINTPTLVARFEAEVTGAGIQLQWQFGEPERVVGAALDRAMNAFGPWIPLTVTTRSTADATEAIDRSVVPGESYYYRLTAHLSDGTQVVFGPIRGDALRAAKVSGLTDIAPNPAPGRARIDFALVRREHVRISVVDLMGREAAILANGPMAPGNYSMVWDGHDGSKRLPAGVYFVRWVSAGGSMNRRLVLVR